MNDLLDDTALDLLLAPLSAAQPCGPDINGGMTYAGIREARRVDDPNQGVWEKQVPKRADWGQVERLCLASLGSESKDLNVCAWLCEAWIQLRGVAGLADGLQLIDAMASLYWDQVHPLPEGGDIGFRTAPFEWLNRNLPLAMQAAPLAPGVGPGGRALTLSEWEAVLRAEREYAQLAASRSSRQPPPPPPPEQTQRSHFAAAAAMAPQAYYEQLHLHIGRCGSALEELNAHLASLLGVDTPSLSALHGVVRICTEAAFELGGAPRHYLDGHEEHEEHEAMNDDTGDDIAYAGEAPALPPLRRGAIDSRTEAYRRLAEVADYLQRTEPHSPVPYLVRRACSWGEMELEELFSELLDSESDLKQIFRLLGTRPK